MKTSPLFFCLALNALGSGCQIEGGSIGGTTGGARPTQDASLRVASSRAVPNANPTPVLLFSDLDGGPRSGNSDTSLGQKSGEDGAIVSVWGAHLGSAQGTSKVLVNGAEGARVYYWGDAVSPYSPAKLHNKFTKLQIVLFQVSHSAREGSGEITVEVNGQKSNPLPFVVRPGRILFVKKSGSDTWGRGSWSKPWKSINRAVNRFRNGIAPGDVIYVGDGVSQTTWDGNDSESSAVNLNSDGKPGRLVALVAYPGARVVVGSPALEAFGTWVTNENHASTYWTLAKLEILGVAQPLPLKTGFRAVGNRISAPRGDGATGTVGAHGSDILVLGNEVTNCGSEASSYLYHVIYVSGHRSESGPRLPTESNREVAWNYIHDNLANRAINIYSEGNRSAYIEGHRVHHNVIVNQRGDGILLGYFVTGENWVYANLLINAGDGPKFEDGGTQHTCLNIRAGVESVPRTKSMIHVYNNTMYGCGWPGAGKASGAVEIVRSSNHTLDVHNNIIYSTQSYLTGYSDSPNPNAAALGNNLWFGHGDAPSWDSNSVSADPQFLDPIILDLHLKPASPALGRGTNCESPMVQVDLDGNLAPQGRCSLGVYQTASVGAQVGAGGRNPERFRPDMNRFSLY